ncbi:MAG: hypothetical protein PVI57_19440 [Gemmatimonadota bacterium]
MNHLRETHRERGAVLCLGGVEIARHHRHHHDAPLEDWLRRHLA